MTFVILYTILPVLQDACLTDSIFDIPWPDSMEVSECLSPWGQAIRKGCVAVLAPPFEQILQLAQRLLLSHDNKELTPQRLVWIRLVLESMCGTNVVELILCQPLQSGYLFDSSDETTDGANRLEHQHLFRDETVRVVLQSNATLLHRLLQALKLRCQP